MTHQPDFRIGQGFDVHRFADIPQPSGSIMMCGVPVPHPYGLVGHSDADVGLHALVDALLGAIGAGDIGEHFPPSDPKWKGADSSLFVEHALALVHEAGGVIHNVDITIIAEAPKVGPHRAAMRHRVATLLTIDEKRVNIKATTTEGLGFTGRREGIAAQAITSIAIHLKP